MCVIQQDESRILRNHAWNVLQAVLPGGEQQEAHPEPAVSLLAGLWLVRQVWKPPCAAWRPCWGCAWAPNLQSGD